MDFSYSAQAAKVKSDYGSFLGRMDRISEAVTHLRRAVSFRSRDPAAHSHLRIALAMQRLFAETEPHCANALAINSNRLEAHYHLGLLLAEKEEYEKVIFLSGGPRSGGACASS